MKFFGRLVDWFLLAVAVFGGGVASVAIVDAQADPVVCEERAAIQDTPPAPLHPFNVVFRMNERGNRVPTGNLLEIRIRTKAPTEGQATVQALLFLQQYLVNADFELLQFMDVQKADEEKRK